MNETNKKYVNRKTYYSKSDRTASQYKVTAISIEKDSDKVEQTNVIMGDYLGKTKEVNLSKKISQNKADDFLCKTIFTIGLLKDKTKNISNANTREANFLFIDFEEPKDIVLSDKDKKALSFNECIRILEENELNYVLKTSYSHTEEKPRLHLFLPLLKPIRSDAEYKENLQFIKDKYFSDFHMDESTKNISRWVFSSKSDTLRFLSCFEKNDIEPQKLDKRLLRVMTQASKKKITFNPDEENLQNFVKQSR